MPLSNKKKNLFQKLKIGTYILYFAFKAGRFDR